MRNKFLFLTALILACANIAHTQTINRGAIAYYGFNDSSAADKSGNNLHGAAYGIDIFPPGVVKSSARFESASNSHVSLPALDFGRLNDFTISLWVKAESIVDEHDGAAYFFAGDLKTGWCGIFHENNINYPGGDEDYICFSVGGKGLESALKFKVMPEDWEEWVFYCLVYRDGFIYAYKNNMLMDIAKEQADNGSFQAFIGAFGDNGNVSTGFTGLIDEVRIYERGISEKEIKYLFYGCGDNSFEFVNFLSEYGLKKIGNISNHNNRFYLTESKAMQKGAVWFKDKANYTNGFVVEFAFRVNEGVTDEIDDGSLPGADGLAFILQNYSDSAIGESGMGIGFVGIPQSFAIEYDLYRNDERTRDLKDPNGNHIAVFSKGSLPNDNYHSGLEYIGGASDIITIEPGGRIYYSMIEYGIDKNVLRVYIDTMPSFNKPALELSDLDLREYLGDGGNEAYFGFTAATGTSYQSHELISWSVCTYPDLEILSVGNKNHNLEHKNEMEAFPNPFYESLTVKLNCPMPDLKEIKVFNVLGIEVKGVEITRASDNANSVVLRFLKAPPGAYYLSFNSTNSSRFSKIIKSR